MSAFLKKNSRAMIRTFSLLLLFEILSLTAPAQISGNGILKRFVTNELMIQVMNDFSKTLSAENTAPGYYILENRNLFFDEQNYFGNEDVVRSGDYFQTEVIDALQAVLISEIPSGSIMNVDIRNGEQLLFNLRFLGKSDTAVCILTEAGLGRSKTISTAGGRIIADSYVDVSNETNNSSRLMNDTLRISDQLMGKSGRNTRTEIHYQAGVPLAILDYEKSRDAYDLVSIRKYSYLAEQYPGFMELINRKGKVADSAHYYYEGDKLLQYQKYTGGKEKFNVLFNYTRTGQLSTRTVRSPNRNYSVDYSYSGGKIADVEIDDRGRESKRHFIYGYNDKEQLVRLEYNVIQKESLVENLKEAWTFEYNKNGNIRSVQILDGSGEPVRKIDFEYSYF